MWSKTNNMKKVNIIIIWVICLILINYELQDWRGGIIIMCSIPLMFIFGYIYDGYHEPQEPKKDYSQYYYSNYQKSLRNKDGEASYWGNLYYEDLYKPHSIHQQNQIQLKIQNDILSHS